MLCDISARVIMLCDISARVILLCDISARVISVLREHYVVRLSFRALHSADRILKTVVLGDLKILQTTRFYILPVFYFTYTCFVCVLE